MTISISVVNSLDDINPAEYQAFFLRSQAPLFYDWRFLLAAERSPLLAVHKVFYILVRDQSQLTAFMPAYLQDIRVIDPLGILTKAVNLSFQPEDRGLFSHIMQCFDSTIPVLVNRSHLYSALFETLTDIARTEGARYFGFLNIQDDSLLREAGRYGLNIHYMVDKYSADLGNLRDFDHAVQSMPKDGRHEMNRQLRKFDTSNAVTRILAPPFGEELEYLTHLCYLTTKRLGTPQYWPAEPLAKFCRLCEDLIRLSVVEVDGQLISGFVCFEEPGILHAWTAGIVYEKTDFSPYTIGLAEIYRYAFKHGIKQLEAGRLNARIKTRLGFKPSRLYAIISPDLHTQKSTRPTDPTSTLINALDGEVRMASHPAFEDWYQRSAWNGRNFYRRPAGILYATTEADVIKAITFAKQQGLRISVRGGGHSYAGSFLRSGTLLLDVSGLHGVQIDTQRARAIVEPGVTSEQLCSALATHGLAFPTGHGRGVAISGFLLGGGLGINCNTWGGMSVFNIEALDLVTADGHCRHVDATHHRDLFWAARGSGPTSFFVVTRFYLRCWPVPPTITNSVYTAPFSVLGALLTAIEKAAPQKNLQTMLAVIPSTTGGLPSVVLNTIAFTHSLEDARATRESLLIKLPPVLTLVEEDQPSSFEQLYRQTDTMLVSSRYRSDNILTNRTQDIAPILGRYMVKPPSSASIVLIVWRGKQTYPDAAFSAQGLFFVSTYAQWNHARDDDKNSSWLRKLYDELADIASNAYINEFDLEQRAAQVERCFAPAHWEKLQRLRHQYDPDKVFVAIEEIVTIENNKPERTFPDK